VSHPADTSNAHLNTFKINAVVAKIDI